MIEVACFIACGEFCEQALFCNMPVPNLHEIRWAITLFGIFFWAYHGDIKDVFGEYGKNSRKCLILNRIKLS